MLSFKQFINETESFNDPKEIVERIRAECMPFVKDIRFTVNSSDLPIGMFRGMDMNKPLLKLHGYRPRLPKDSSSELHKILDQHFIEQFGFPYRSMGIFCSTSWKQAFYYGDKLFLIFPIGSNYKYIYSPQVEDAYHKFDNSKNGLLPELFKPICASMGVEQDSMLLEDGILDDTKWYPLVKEWLDKTTPYTDVNLGDFIHKNHRHGYEIMVNTKEYYALRVDPEVEGNGINTIEKEIVAP